MLFRDAPRALVEKVETVVRLIRSKGVGVYFVTQNPLDLPLPVLGQLGNRVQHALRAFTPMDQKAVRSAAETFRPNPKLRVEEAITQLGVGEALVSTLAADGTPTMVERARIAPPRGRIGPLTAEERAAAIAGSPLAGRYDTPLDRDSAYEALQGRATTAADAEPGPAAPTRGGDPWGGRGGDGPWWRTGGAPAPAPPIPTTVPRVPTRRTAAGAGRRAPAAERDARPDDVLGGGGSGGGRGRGRQSPAEAMATSMARSLGTTFGRKIGGAVLRGVLGSILKR